MKSYILENKKSKCTIDKYVTISFVIFKAFYSIVPHHVGVCLIRINREICLVCQQPSIRAAVQLDECSAAVVTSVTAV